MKVKLKTKPTLSLLKTILVKYINSEFEEKEVKTYLYDIFIKNAVKTLMQREFKFNKTVSAKSMFTMFFVLIERIDTIII